MEKAFLSKIHETARDGFQFLFDSLIVPDNAVERRAEGLLVDRMIEALNHPASLDQFRTITGEPAIRVVNGQATRYLPGHFLASYDDEIDGEGRGAAYVINLTRGWGPDWGGILQFHNAGISYLLCSSPVRYHPLVPRSANTQCALCRSLCFHASVCNYRMAAAVSCSAGS